MELDDFLQRVIDQKLLSFRGDGARIGLQSMLGL